MPENDAKIASGNGDPATTCGSSSAPGCSADLFGIVFEGGNFLFDLWPKDPREAIGRRAVFVWKTCYPEQGIPDMFHVGRIVAVDGDRVEINQGAGSSRVLLDHVFLLPVTASGCPHATPPKLGYIEFHQDAEDRVARGERQHYCASCGKFIWAGFWPNVSVHRTAHMHSRWRPRLG